MLSNNIFKRIKNFRKDEGSLKFESITLGELLTENFISNFSDFSDFDQMITVSGIKTTSNSFTDIFISKEWKNL